MRAALAAVHVRDRPGEEGRAQALQLLSHQGPQLRTVVRELSQAVQGLVAGHGVAALEPGGQLQGQGAGPLLGEDPPAAAQEPGVRLAHVPVLRGHVPAGGLAQALHGLAHQGMAGIGCGGPLGRVGQGHGVKWV